MDQHQKNVAAVLKVLLPLLASVIFIGQAKAADIDFSTYLPSIEWSSVREVAYDSEGNIIVAMYGSIRGSDYAGVSAQLNYVQPGNANRTAADDQGNLFIFKIVPDGSRMLWGTIIDGQSGPHGAGGGLYGLEVHNDYVYVAGTTFHEIFPTTANAWDDTYNDDPAAGRSEHGDGFFLVLNPNGGLVYSTYIGGSGWDTVRGGLEVDLHGNVYLVGSTNSNNFLSGVPIRGNNNKHARGFLVRLSEIKSSSIDSVPDRFNVDYVYYLGGNGAIHEETLVGVVVDKQGLIYMSQWGWGPGAEITDNAWQPRFGGGLNDFLYTVLDPREDPLNPTVKYATYLGKRNFDGPEHRLAVDDHGQVYLVGTTGSSDFPAVSADQPRFGGGEDGILLKFDAMGRLRFSTFIGTEGKESVFGPTIDNNNNVWVAGFTTSRRFAAKTTKNAINWKEDLFGTVEGRSYQGGPRDAIILQYTSDGALLMASLFGGNGTDYARYISTAPNGDIIVVGETDSSDFPTKNAIFPSNRSGQPFSFLTRISLKSQ